jgi:hypothetical protein
MVDRIQLLQQAITHGGQRAFDNVPSILQNVLKDKLWLEKSDRDGKRFQSFEAFATYPLWWGLDTTIDDLRVFCRKRADVLSMIDDALKPLAKAGRPTADNPDNVSINSDYGNGAHYTMRRLLRDRPDLADKVKAGELSANAAAIEAGFRQRTVAVGGKPETSANLIIRSLGFDYAQSLVDALSDALTKIEKRKQA